MKFSVIVLTYHSKLEKIFLTLQSLIMQDFDEFEIILTDDGSAENHFSQIREFFAERNFSDYRLLAHSQNQGTVKNLLSGLRAAAGKYAKAISAGDALYDRDTLKKLYRFLSEHQIEGCFGLLEGYRFDQENRVRRVKYYHPFDIQAYRKKDAKRIQKNLILYSDNVCGAAICGTVAFETEYLEKIQKYVKYEEDIFQVLSAVEGRELQLYDDYMIWYEIGEGVSTKKRSEFEELLRIDVEKFYRMLYQKFREKPYVKKRFFLQRFYVIRNLYLRTILRFFVNPDAINYLIRSALQRKRGMHRASHPSKGLLEQREFWEGLQSEGHGYQDEYINDGELVHAAGKGKTGGGRLS